MRAAIDALRIVDVELRSAWEHDVVSSQADVLAYYTRDTTTLTNGGKAYLSLLNALDLLALALEHRLASTRIVEEHVPTLVRTDVVSLTFLTDLRKACEDASVYSHLGRLLTKLESHRRASSGHSSVRPS